MSLTCQRRREEELTGYNGTRDFFGLVIMEPTWDMETL